MAPDGTTVEVGIVNYLLRLTVRKDIDAHCPIRSRPIYCLMYLLLAFSSHYHLGGCFLNVTRVVDDYLFVDFGCRVPKQKYKLDT
jgi:hypothetical protein